MNNDKNLVFSAAVFLLILFIWPVFMILCQVDGDMEAQMLFILENITLHNLQFFMAFLISPSLLFLMASYEKQIEYSKPQWLKLGWIFFTAYLVLCSIAYASQIVVLPKLIEGKDLATASFWSMNDNNSVIYFLNQTGYAFWAAGTLLFFHNEYKSKGLKKAVSIVMVFSAFLSLVAYAGLLVGSALLNYMTMVSGLLLVPVAVLMLMHGIKIRAHGE